jgi:hypothetical protein
MLQQITEDANKNWIAQSGLMRLKGPHETGNIDGLETVWNDNGIFFLSIYILLLRTHGETYPAVRVRETLDLIEVPDHPGLFNRNVYRTSVAPQYEAHDNYIAIAVLSKLYDTRHLRSIVLYGVEHGWNYNNIEPHVWKKECQRQGGEVAFYMLMAGYVPSILDTIWMLGGFIVNLVQWKYSLVMLTWLRIEGLRLVTPTTPWARVAVKVMIAIWDIVFERRGGIKAAAAKSFKPTHPARRLAELL